MTSPNDLRSLPSPEPIGTAISAAPVSRIPDPAPETRWSQDLVWATVTVVVMWLTSQRADSNTSMLETAQVLVGTAVALRVTVALQLRGRGLAQRLGEAAQAFRNGGAPRLEPP